MLAFLILFSFALGDEKVAHNAEPTFPRGVKNQENFCFMNRVQSDNISWIWDKPRVANRFYTFLPLDESSYRSFQHHKKRNFNFFIDQNYFNPRFTQQEQNQFYEHFPEAKTNYNSLLLSKDVYHGFSEEKEEVIEESHYRHRFYSFVLDSKPSLQPRLMAIFEDVYATHRGLIVHPKTCDYVYNGGCVYMMHETFFELHSQPRQVDQAITLGSGASGTWHFPMELFVSFSGVDPALLYDPHVLIHMPRTNFWISDWMNLLNISDDRLIYEHTIEAKKLYAPEPGRCCQVFASQLEWMNDKFNPLPVEKRVHSSQRTIIFIGRSTSRLVGNEQQIVNHIQQFARNHHYSFVYHNDGNLPSLQDQIFRFAQAPIVIAPHGAGLLFTTFSPGNACIREFMPPNNPECYARIGFLRALNYRMYMLDDHGNFRLEEINESLEDCHRYFESSLVNNSPASSPIGFESLPKKRQLPGSGTTLLHKGSWLLPSLVFFAFFAVFSCYRSMRSHQIIVSILG